MAIVIPPDASRTVQEAFQELERRVRDLERAHAKVSDEIASSAQAVSDKAEQVAVKEARKAALWNEEFDVVRGGSGHTMGAAPDPGYHDKGGPRYLTSDGEWAPLLDGALVSADPGYAGTSLAQKVVGINGSLAVTGALQADRVYSQYMNGRVVGCHVTNSADVTIATGATPVIVACDTTIFDTHGFHSNVTNNSRITIPSGMGGYYLIMGAYRWEDINDSDGYRAISIEKNADGTHDANAIIAQNIVCQASTGSDVVNCSVASVHFLAAGDRVELYAGQSSGSDVKVIYVAGGVSPLFQVIRLGW